MNEADNLWSNNNAAYHCVSSHCVLGSYAMH